MDILYKYIKKNKKLDQPKADKFPIEAFFRGTTKGIGGLFKNPIYTD